MAGPVGRAFDSLVHGGKGRRGFRHPLFERYVDEPGRPLDLRLPRRFATALPPSPLSYDGRIVKVCWCARLRIYPQQGPEAFTRWRFVWATCLPRRSNHDSTALNFGRSPSRHTNPFATCWTKPARLRSSFRGESAANGRSPSSRPLGGAAKSSAPMAPASRRCSNRSRPTWSPPDAASPPSRSATASVDFPRRFLRESLALRRPLVIVDGYEQLSWLSRRMLRVRCRFASAGLLITSHAPTCLPPLFHTQPSLQLAEQLVSTLTAQHFSPISAADVAASHACHGSNLRELFFALYDRHESLAGAAHATARAAASSSS